MTRVLVMLMACLCAAGCARDRQSAGLAEDARWIQQQALDLARQAADDNPLRARLLELADRSGKHASDCDRLQTQWKLMSGLMNVGDPASGPVYGPPYQPQPNYAPTGYQPSGTLGSSVPAYGPTSGNSGR